MKFRVHKRYLVFIIALIIVFTKNLFEPSPTTIQVSYSTQKQIVKVENVIDGDTIVIEGNKKVRYIGMDTPELHHPKKSVQCFGKEAMEENKRLVEGKKVILQKDVSETDQYGRLLRYVWLSDEASPSAKGLFVNEYLVHEGYAHVATFPPDVTYVELFMNAEKEAREQMKGLWNSCQ